jgi:hypothetical protein
MSEALKSPAYRPLLEARIHDKNGTYACGVSTFHLCPHCTVQTGCLKKASQSLVLSLLSTGLRRISQVNDTVIVKISPASAINASAIILRHQILSLVNYLHHHLTFCPLRYQSTTLPRCITLQARDAKRWNGTPIPQAMIQTAMRSGVREDSPVMASAE